MARAYAKTWHGEDFGKPKYRETDSGIEIITGAEFMNNATNIAELGGWLVKPEFRGQKLAQGLTFATVDFIKRMQNLCHKVNKS